MREDIATRTRRKWGEYTHVVNRWLPCRQLPNSRICAGDNDDQRRPQGIAAQIRS